MTVLTYRTGFEIELLAPMGLTRRTLAERVAANCSGHLERLFHTDSEPSLVPGMGHFWHLTPGFLVRDLDGRPIATFVDDITLISDIRQAKPQTDDQPPARQEADLAEEEGFDEGWYRVLSDDARLLRLIAGHASAAAPLGTVLDDVAELFGTKVEAIGRVRRLQDAAEASIAMATGLAVGRERPCEVITPPLSADHEDVLEGLLRPARELGFTVPLEAAVHMHIDGAPFRCPSAFANLVRLFGYWREHLRHLLETNPACTRLQALPEGLLTLIEDIGGEDDHRVDAWRLLQEAAAGTGLTKYFDVNLTSLLSDHPQRDTVEIRILPGSIMSTDIVKRASIVEHLLTRCLDPLPISRPSADSDDARAELRRMAGI